MKPNEKMVLFQKINTVRKTKKHPTAASVGYLRLHIVELRGELALVTSSLVGVDDATSSSLVDLLNCELVSSSSLFLVACLNCSIVLLDYSAELGLEDLVLECLGLDNLYALLSRLDIRHFLVLPDDLRQTNKNNLVSSQMLSETQSCR